MTTFVGIDFEIANGTRGSICAYGLAFEDGTTEKEIIALHPETGGEQEREKWHSITPAATAAGAPFAKLYARLRELGDDVVLVAHDARCDRRELLAAFAMWGVPALPLSWVDSLGVARRMFGKTNKTGISTMAEKLGMAVTPHDPADDALVALAVVRTYGLRGIPVAHFPAA